MVIDKTELEPGTKVRFISQELHDKDPRYFPIVGTVGVVRFLWRGSGNYFVEWPVGTTTGDWTMSTPADALEVVCDE